MGLIEIFGIIVGSLASILVLLVVSVAALRALASFSLVEVRERLSRVETDQGTIEEYQETEVKKLRAKEQKRKEKAEKERLEALAEARARSEMEGVSLPPQPVNGDRSPQTQVDAEYLDLCRRASKRG